MCLGGCGCECVWVDVDVSVLGWMCMWVCLGGWVGVVCGSVRRGVAVRIVPLQGWVVGMHAHTCTLVASQYRSSVQQCTHM